MSESAEPTSRLLSERQRKLAGFAIGFVSLAVIIWLLGKSFGLFAQFIGHFSGVLWPITTAAVAALVLKPAVNLLENRFKLSRVASVVILYALVALAFGGFLLLIIPAIVEQLLDFIAFLPIAWQRASEFVQAQYPAWVEIAQRHADNETIKSILTSFTGEIQGLLGNAVPSLKAAGSGAMGVFGFVAALAIVPIYLFFFLLSRSDPTGSMHQHLTFLNEDMRNDVVFLVRNFIDIVVSFFRGQLLIGLIMGLLLTLGFWLVGLKFALVLGLTLGILNIIPYLGTIVGLSLTLPLAFFQTDGGWALLALTLVVFILVQNIEGWLLTPKIMGDRTGLHPVAIIFAVFFWGAAFDGILGMILAIPLTAFFVTAWRLARQKYFVAE
ncbi:AI-2E family transporter [Opitutaceae bacterium]|nr:AI-2E family transporter [bacterium]MDB4384869.1 AI-2E family transporter [Opitutaceae bacterium]